MIDISYKLEFDDFIRSISFGAKEFATEDEVIDYFETYIQGHYTYSIEREDTPPTHGPCRYIFQVSFSDSDMIAYVEKFDDACDYEDKSYTTVQLIRTQKTSHIYKLAFTNSLRKNIEHYLELVDVSFLINGHLQQLEYFGRVNVS